MPLHAVPAGVEEASSVTEYPTPAGIGLIVPASVLLWLMSKLPVFRYPLGPTIVYVTLFSATPLQAQAEAVAGVLGRSRSAPTCEQAVAIADSRARENNANLADTNFDARMVLPFTALALGQRCARSCKRGASAKFLQISGLGYTWDAAQPIGSRVVETHDAAGVTLNPVATYSITCNNFLATGGDGFTAFVGGTNPIGPVDVDAMIDYTEHHNPLQPPLKGRITRLH